MRVLGRPILIMGEADVSAKLLMATNQKTSITFVLWVANYKDHLLPPQPVSLVMLRIKLHFSLTKLHPQVDNPFLPFRIQLLNDECY